MVGVLGLLTCIPFLLQSVSGKRLAHIIDGTIGDISNFPYQAQLHAFNMFVCGGCIINERFIVTAAHCVEVLSFEYDKNKIAKNIDPEQFRVAVGANSAKDPSAVFYNVSHVSYHEKYNDPGNEVEHDFDIAILRVQKKIQLNEKVKPASLPSKEPQPGDIVTISGYGSTQANRRRESLLRFQKRHEAGDLRFVKIPVVPWQECYDHLEKKYHSKISKNNICAGAKTGNKDACFGDSGGPMVMNNNLVGVVSWGEGCGREGDPGIYISVLKFLPWIQSKMKLMGESSKKSRSHGY